MNDDACLRRSHRFRWSRARGMARRFVRRGSAGETSHECSTRKRNPLAKCHRIPGRVVQVVVYYKPGEPDSDALIAYMRSSAEVPALFLCAAGRTHPVSPRFATRCFSATRSWSERATDTRTSLSGAPLTSLRMQPFFGVEWWWCGACLRACLPALPACLLACLPAWLAG